MKRFLKRILIFSAAVLAYVTFLSFATVGGELDNLIGNLDKGCLMGFTLGECINPSDQRLIEPRRIGHHYAKIEDSIARYNVKDVVVKVGDMEYGVNIRTLRESNEVVGITAHCNPWRGESIRRTWGEVPKEYYVVLDGLFEKHGDCDVDLGYICADSGDFYITRFRLPNNVNLVFTHHEQFGETLTIFNDKDAWESSFYHRTEWLDIDNPICGWFGEKKLHIAAKSAKKNQKRRNK